MNWIYQYIIWNLKIISANCDYVAHMTYSVFSDGWIIYLCPYSKPYPRIYVDEFRICDFKDEFECYKEALILMRKLNKNMNNKE